MINKVNPDKLMRYILKSNPERSIHIPLKHFYRAGKLVNLALENKSAGTFDEKLSLYPSLKEMYIPEKTWELMWGDKEDALKLQDEVYFTTCLHLIYNELACMDGELANGHEYRARERYNAIRNHQNIKNMLESL